MENKTKKTTKKAKKTSTKTISKKNIKKISDGNEYYYAGFVIIVIAVIELIVTLFGGGIWLGSLSFETDSAKTTIIDGKSFNVEVNNLDQDVLFANTYYKALDVLSEGIAFGTTWLEICPNTQTEINGEIYIEICDERYSSVDSIKNSLNEYISIDYINKLMDNNFLDYNGKLYIKPINISKNQNYAGFVSYKLINKTNDKVTYLVKSKYIDLNCNENCDFEYKDHIFELTKEEGNWVVSNFEMPY